MTTVLQASDHELPTTDLAGSSVKKLNVGKFEKMENTVREMYGKLLTRLETAESQLVELEKQRIDMEAKAMEK